MNDPLCSFGRKTVPKENDTIKGSSQAFRIYPEHGGVTMYLLDRLKTLLKTLENEYLWLSKEIDMLTEQIEKHKTATVRLKRNSFNTAQERKRFNQWRRTSIELHLKRSELKSIRDKTSENIIRLASYMKWVSEKSWMGIGNRR